MTEPLKDFIQRTIARGDSWREIAAKADTNHSTLLRWVKSNELPASTLVEICRQYSYPLGDAFVAAGYITTMERDSFNGPNALTAVSDEDLLAEVLRRIQDGNAHDILTTPIEDAHVSGLVNNQETGRQAEYDLVSHPYTEETGDLMDE